MFKALLLNLLTLFKWLLFARLIIDYVRMFARNWRPKSAMIALFEVVYAITDPPMKFVGRFIPPLRLGGVSLDLSFIVILLALNFATNIIRVAL
ncbi:MAG: YggT family protein [Candidatus Planktophila sp.]